MLRSAAFGLRHGSRLVVLASNRPSSSTMMAKMAQPRTLLLRQDLQKSSHWRVMSSQAKSNDDPPKEEGKAGGDNDDTKEIVLTPGQKVVAASRLGMWAGIFGFACACAYFIGKELIPTKMSPQHGLQRGVPKSPGESSSSQAVRRFAQVLWP